MILKTVLSSVIFFGLMSHAFSQALSSLNKVQTEGVSEMTEPMLLNGSYDYIGVTVYQSWSISVDKDGMITGETLEPNAWGGDNTSYKASLEGHIDDRGNVRVVKTYDGSDGWTHSIYYSGTCVKNSFTGDWAWYEGEPVDRFTLMSTVDGFCP